MNLTFELPLFFVFEGGIPFANASLPLLVLQKDEVNHDGAAAARIFPMRLPGRASRGLGEIQGMTVGTNASKQASFLLLGIHAISIASKQARNGIAKVT